MSAQPKHWVHTTMVVVGIATAAMAYLPVRSAHGVAGGCTVLCENLIADEKPKCPAACGEDFANDPYSKCLENSEFAFIEGHCESLWWERPCGEATTACAALRPSRCEGT